MNNIFKIGIVGGLAFGLYKLFHPSDIPPQPANSSICLNLILTSVFCFIDLTNVDFLFFI
jgi:hypothetical protein